MNSKLRLNITEHQHTALYHHLFPGDGLEAAAILLCTHTDKNKKRWLVKDIIVVEHSACRVRTMNQLSWPGTAIEDAIDKAETEQLSIVLAHSHPGGLFEFSEVDDGSDAIVLPGIFEAFESKNTQHGSAIMTPDGAMLSRLYNYEMKFEMFDFVMCAGDDIKTWRNSANTFSPTMAFSSQMRHELGDLTACVVGVSGTGSIVTEQLARMGFGSLILIDFDHIEYKNLNRILNTTVADADAAADKVDVIARAIAGFSPTTKVDPVSKSIFDRDSILTAGNADVIFCCIDTLEGRQICDKLAAAFAQPLFDVAVTIPTRIAKDESVVIGDVCGRLDYIKPGGSSLFDRKVYTPESLRREYLMRVAPADFEEQVNAGYIKGVNEEAPSVIALNMQAASACVMEYIARAFPYRHEPNGQYARTMFSMAACEVDFECESDFQRGDNKIVSRGLTEPLLDVPALAAIAKPGECKC